MPVTSRSLRRLRGNPTAVKVGAGILASAIGMTTAAYGILHIVVPFKGNGARSEFREAEENPTPGSDLIASVLALVPAEDPLAGDGDVLFSIDGASGLVTSVLDGATGSTTGIVGGGSGGSGGSGGTGGNSGGLLGSWEGPTFSPPSGGGGEGRTLDVPPVNITPPSLPLGDVIAIEGDEGDQCTAKDPALTDGVDRSVDSPFLPEAGEPEAAEADAEADPCEEPPAEEAPAEEQPPADGNGGRKNK